MVIVGNCYNLVSADCITYRHHRSECEQNKAIIMCSLSLIYLSEDII